MPGAGAAWAVVLIFVIAALTDLADGYIARKYGLVTPFGQIMDPIADKLLILTALLIFSLEGTIQAWMAALIACREISVTAVRLTALTKGKLIPAESAGKLKAAFQMLAAALALVYRLGLVCGPAPWFTGGYQAVWLSLINGIMLIAVILTLWSGQVFFKNFFHKG